ncbi:MAG: hypothetical protein Q8M26_11465 [Pseudolabrys sp.]|nr:hypothetical protein [Pseudolabrys sp.]
MLYKRNQVEEAIERFVRTGRSEVITRLKRLLDTDRAAGKPYAFFSTKPSGKGFEVEFTEYTVFALWAGLTLLAHGFPQQSSVAILKRARSELEAEHERISHLPDDIFPDAQELYKRARPGSLVVSNSQPVFLVVERPATDTSASAEASGRGFAICRGEAALMMEIKSRLTAKTILEIVSAAKGLHSLLATTKPEPRGRRPGN